MLLSVLEPGQPEFVWQFRVSRRYLAHAPAFRLGCYQCTYPQAPPVCRCVLQARGSWVLLSAQDLFGSFVSVPVFVRAYEPAGDCIPHYLALVFLVRFFILGFPDRETRATAGTAPVAPASACSRLCSSADGFFGVPPRDVFTCTSNFSGPFCAITSAGPRLPVLSFGLKPWFLSAAATFCSPSLPVLVRLGLCFLDIIKPPFLTLPRSA